VPEDRVLVTGAHCFDGWFTATPSRSRERFCRMVGLDPGRPFVLYVGSSVFIAPDEVPFAERWRRALRTAPDPVVRSAGVLIRPHPANARQWRALDPNLPETAVWPPIGTDPSSPDFRRDYFDSLHHCAAVVGINTSAQLEAAILARPVFTVRAPDFAHAHAGTLHFQHLVDPDGGFVHAADTLERHVEQLAAALDGRLDPAQANVPFVRSFIRPFGTDVASASVFARTIDALLRLPPPPRQSGPWWAAPVQPFAAVLAQVARTLAEDRPLWVYALRPLITVAVWGWAAPFVLQNLARSVRRGLKPLRRSIRRTSYEALQALRKRRRRANKTLGRAARTAGSAARRLVRKNA
jgi:hypothetical protein